MSTLNIEIDCPPGQTRPDVYFNYILKLLESCDDKQLWDFAKKCIGAESASRSFGNWSWYISFNRDNIHLKSILQTHFKTELTKLYNSGRIRYASW